MAPKVKTVKPRTLTQLVAAAKPRKCGNVSWYSLLDPQIRAQLDELHDDYHDGKLQGFAKAHIYRTISVALKLNVKLSAFKCWLEAPYESE